MLNTIRMTSVVFFIIAIASSMAWAITVSRLPQNLTAFFMQYINNKYVFLLFVNLLLLVVGMLLDQAPAVLVMTPILLPMAQTFGVHPIHFAIIVCVNLTIGLITPPIGMQLFVCSAVGKISLSSMYKVIIPFALVEIVALFVITYIPSLVLFVPRLFGF